MTHSISLEPEAATTTPLASCMSESGEPKKRELTRRPNPENIPLGTCSCRTLSPLYNMRTKWRRNRRRGEDEEKEEERKEEEEEKQVRYITSILSPCGSSATEKPKSLILHIMRHKCQPEPLVG